jgi:hypothetical protein
MSSLSDYTDLLSVIQAIKPENTVVPNMPVDVFVQETEDQYHWCIDDQVALTQAGLDWSLVTSLPTRAGACREAQSLWNKERNTREQSEQDWKDQSPAAFNLRDELIHTFRYAFRNQEGLLGRVDEIAQGDTNSDMIQDLNDLAELGKANLDLLAVVNFDASLLNLAADLADQMGDLLGATNGERKKDSEAMIIRDQAFTYLKQAMDEIRNCGKYVFWRNADRLKGYTSDYWKAKHATTDKPTAKVTPQA